MTLGIPLMVGDVIANKTELSCARPASLLNLTTLNFCTLKSTSLDGEKAAEYIMLCLPNSLLRVQDAFRISA